MSLRQLPGDLSRAATAITEAAHSLGNMPGPATAHQMVGYTRASMDRVVEATEDTAEYVKTAAVWVGAAAILIAFYFASKIVKEALDGFHL